MFGLTGCAPCALSSLAVHEKQPEQPDEEAPAVEDRSIKEPRDAGQLGAQDGDHPPPPRLLHSGARALSPHSSLYSGLRPLTPVALVYLGLKTLALEAALHRGIR